MSHERIQLRSEGVLVAIKTAEEVLESILKGKS